MQRYASKVILRNLWCVFGRRTSRALTFGQVAFLICISLLLCVSRCSAVAEDSNDLEDPFVFLESALASRPDLPQDGQDALRNVLHA